MFIKNELPQGRTLMATLGDDGDKNIYMYVRFLFKKVKHAVQFSTEGCYKLYSFQAK